MSEIDLAAKGESTRASREQRQVRAADAEQPPDAAAPPVPPTATRGSSRSNEQLLRAIFDGALEPMVLTDGDGRYVDANRAACELYGLPLEQLIGRAIAELAGEYLVTEAAYLAFREQGHMRGQFSLERPDGTRRILEYKLGVSTSHPVSTCRLCATLRSGPPRRMRCGARTLFSAR